MKTRKTRAFTLVEMMAVVVIIGILAAVIAPKFFGQVNKTQIVRAKKDIETIKQAVTLFKFNTNNFPEDLKELVYGPEDAEDFAPLLEKKSFRDPWDNEYQYRIPVMDGRDFDIWSYGQDGKEGGEGLNADINSWEDEE